MLDAAEQAGRNETETIITRKGGGLYCNDLFYQFRRGLEQPLLHAVHLGLQYKNVFLQRDDNRLCAITSSGAQEQPFHKRIKK